MDTKSEGAAFPPVPIAQSRPREVIPRGAALRDAGEPRCEMCGCQVIASHCKRICLRCGFLTGCSEGV